MDYNPSHFVAYTQPETTYQFMLQMSSMNFYSLVRSAACRLIENFELTPTKPHTREAPQSVRLARTVVDGIPGLKHDIHESEFNTQTVDIGLLRAYIQIVNSQTFPDHNPGEDYTKLLVYVAIHRHQTLVVRLIKEEHRRNGKHFGSKCDYQNKDNFADVKDWYEKYELSNSLEQPLDHPVLPKDEPGYMNWVEIVPNNNHIRWFGFLYKGIGTDNPIHVRFYDFISGEKILVEEAQLNCEDLCKKAQALVASDPNGLNSFMVEKVVK